MPQPTAHHLLATWEQGRRRHALERGLLLHALAVPDAAPETLADRSLGERNAALLALRLALFGDGLDACVECPACGERLEFSLSASQLLAQSGARPEAVEVDGRRFRLPTTRDLARIAAASEPEGAATRLASQLLTGGDLDPQTAIALTPKVAAALELADPQLDFVLAQRCPDPCGHRWSISLDIVSLVWEELEARVRRLLDEVHLLARAYGWTEREILGLTESRRAAYLVRVLA